MSDVKKAKAQLDQAREDFRRAEITYRDAVQGEESLVRHFPRLEAWLRRIGAQYLGRATLVGSAQEELWQVRGENGIINFIILFCTTGEATRWFAVCTPQSEKQHLDDTLADAERRLGIKERA